MADECYKRSVPSAGSGIRWGIIILLVLLGGIIRFYGLDGKSLWRDEVETFIIASEDYGRLTELSLEMPYIPVPPLYFYATRLLNFQLFGHLSLRWAAAFMGLLLIPAVWLLGKEAASFPSPEAAAALTAISPLFIRYSQEARSYTMLALLATLSAYFLIRAERGGGNISWAAFTISIILALYTHHFALMVLAASALYVVLARRRSSEFPGGAKKGILQTWPVWFIIGAAYLPMIGYLARGLAGPRGIALDTIRANVHLSDLPALLSVIGPPGQPVVWAVAALVLTGAIARTPWRPGGKRLIFLWFVVPVVITFAVPFRHAVRIRYIIYIIPAYYILAAAGLTWIFGKAGERCWKKAALGLLCLAVLLSAAAGVRDYFREGKQDWRSAAAFLGEVAGPEDVILVDGRGAKRLNLRNRVLDYYASLGDRVRIIRPGENPDRWLEESDYGGRRLWYVNTLKEGAGDGTLFLEDKGSRLEKEGFRLLPPIKFDAPVNLSAQEVWWLGPTRYRSIVVFPIESGTAGEKNEKWRELVSRALAVPGARVDENYADGW